MPKVSFSTDELPQGLDDRARFSLWRDLYVARYGLLDIYRPSDRPFAVRFEFAPLQGIGIGHFTGTVDRVVRSPRAIKVEGSDDFCLVLNCGRTAMWSRHNGRETLLPAGAATLFSDTEPGELRGGAENAWCSIVIPRRELVRLVAHAEDATATALMLDRPAVRLLRKYLDVCLATPEVEEDPALLAHVGTTLSDLIALALGGSRDAAEIARRRGLPAARLREILAELRRGFTDPAFSPSRVAAKLEVSPRYVQKLLHAIGASFTERVLELRLQKARTMLASPRHDRLKVSEIAYACGFNEVSYFSRCFRRRFGTSPVQYRGDTEHAQPG
jgi:AraC-like DNA-binding protein